MYSSESRILTHMVIREHRKTMGMLAAGRRARTDKLPSWTNNRNRNRPIIDWRGIQTILEQSPCDVLILLDCCASGTANSFEGKGVNEVISACAYNETANGVGQFSFTNALAIELRRLSGTPSFSVGQPYTLLKFLGTGYHHFIVRNMKVRRYKVTYLVPANI